ncbi:hypothetical protein METBISCDRAFT_9940, partial [Metschnikowia bicuspidata]
PGRRFGAKKKLWVWSWFVQDPADTTVAVCDYCGKIIRRQPSDKGSPKKLIEHLTTHKLNKTLVNTTRPMSDMGPLSFIALSVLGPYSDNGLIDRKSSIEQSNQSYFDRLNGALRRSADSEVRFDRSSGAFDDSPYTDTNLLRRLLAFLQENKLPIDVIKLASFHQLVFDLRPEAVKDLLVLDTVFSSCVEVS